MSSNFGSLLREYPVDCAIPDIGRLFILADNISAINLSLYYLAGQHPPQFIASVES